jgi:YspA, cpYpsA-related SLOG family
MRVLVCGGRDYRDVGCVKDTLFCLHAQEKITTIIEGGASGADCYAAEWADEYGITLQTFRADWKKHGRSAGPIRNQQMLDEGKPDLVMAFPGGRGTADMVARAVKANVRVRLIGGSNADT